MIVDRHLVEFTRLNEISGRGNVPAIDLDNWMRGRYSWNAMFVSQLRLFRP